MLMKSSAAMLMLAMTCACATRETRTIVDTSCTSFKAISFAIQPVDKPETADNRYDTKQTTDEVMSHNARWDALCAQDKP